VLGPAVPCCVDDDDGGGNGGGGSSRRWKGERDGEDETQERRRESPAQRGPVRCMADLETRSPQGETRGPKRRPRRIERNSRES